MLVSVAAGAAPLVPGGRVATGSTGGGAGAATGSTGGVGAEAVRRLLQRVERFLEVGTPDSLAAVTGATGGAPTSELRTLSDNLRTTGITVSGLSYVDDASREVTSGRAGSGAPVRVARVLVTWRVRGYDDGASSQEVAMTYREDGGAAVFVTARDGYGRAVPLWLTDRVQVAGSKHALVISASPTTTPARLARTVERAVRDVRSVLTGWRGAVVVEVPRDQAALGRLLGADQRRYAGIAAVTTTPDGSLAARSPVHVFLNPGVLARLGPRGTRIVLAHEATHVATRAPNAAMPPWLVEGFADYVALSRTDVAASVGAAQALAEVRRSGPPPRLPDAADFEAGSPHLGASYEVAWLAARLLARTYGERALVGFYRRAERDSTTAAAFERLGTDETAFTRRWRAELSRLAR